MTRYLVALLLLLPLLGGAGAPSDSPPRLPAAPTPGQIQQWCRRAQGLLFVHNDSAEALSHRIIRQSRRLRYAYGLAQGYCLLGAALRNKAQFPASLASSQKALKLFEMQRRSQGIAEVYNVLALTYKRMGDAQRVQPLTRKALALARLAEQYARQGPYLQQLSRAYLSTGIIYRDLHQLDSAAACYLRAMTIEERHRFVPSALPVCYANYAQLLMDTEQNLPKAVWFLKQAIPLYERDHNLTGLEHAYRNLSWTYRKQGNYTQALVAADQALALGRAIEDPHRLSNSLQASYLAYRDAGKFEEALRFLEEWKNREDSLLNLEKTQAIAQLEKSYTSEKQQARIERLYQDNTGHVRQLTVAGVGLALLMLVLGIMLWQYRTIRRTNAQLQTINRMMLANNGLLAEQAERQTMLMKELHHRVKNNLAIVSSMLRLQSNRLTDETAVVAVREGQQRVEAMALIHQRLYLTETVTTVDMERYITDLTQSLLTAYGYAAQPTFELQIHVTQPLLDVDVALPLGLILNELLTNAFKHAYQHVARPSLRIFLGLEPDSPSNDLLLEVQDNGPGLDLEQWQHALGSFGKRLIASLSEQVGGTVELYTQPGTTYRLRIPPHALEQAA